MWFGQKQRKGEDTFKEQLREVQERSELLDNNCGVGLWEAVLLNGDAMHTASRWTWSPEFRRLIGYETETEYPNVVQSWSDRLHPDDVAPTFAAFVGHMADRSGRSRYDVTYRLKVRDGSYRWFRATGGCRYAADGTTVRACGSLTDIHRQKAAELQMAAAADSDQIVIDALTAALDALAAGDLTAAITISPPPKMQKLKDDFNAALERLRDTMRAVAVNATAIQSGSDEITRATDDLSKRTEQQAASLEETAAALDEITATVRKTSQGATHARDVVSSAKTDAEHTGQVVRQAVEAMGSIEKSASQISQIIGVIDEIAFQTNLLALNAGVEAARAGDAGRGFAVVASEVRALAQRSAEAAKEIKTLISASTNQVAQGVDRVAQTGKALDRIMQQVAEIHGIVVEFSVSAQEQATGLDQVNTAINQMDQVTQQNAAMVEQTTAASYEMANETVKLSELIARFVTGDAATRPRYEAARAGKAAPRSLSKTPMRAPVQALKTVGRGGAALKPVAQSQAAIEGWQEF